MSTGTRMSTPDLFDSAGVDVPDAPPRRHPRHARDLLAAVEALYECVDPTYPDRCEAVARQAERIGAHSVARACRWLIHPEALGRHGPDHLHITAERIAKRWAERVERTWWDAYAEELERS